MIQVADTRDDERVKSCRIHDLLRDLAISEAKEEKLFEVDENIDVDMLPTSVRRLIDNINQTNSPHLILNKSIDEGDEVCLHKCSKLLRVLHVDLVQDRSGVFLTPQVPLQIASSGNHPKTTRGNNTLSFESHATQTA